MLTMKTKDQHAQAYALALSIWRLYPGGNYCLGQAPGPSRHCNGPTLWKKAAAWCKKHDQAIYAGLRCVYPGVRATSKHVKAVETWEENRRKINALRRAPSKLRAKRLREKRRNRYRAALGRLILRRFPQAIDKRQTGFNRKVAAIAWCRERHPRIFLSLIDKVQ